MCGIAGMWGETDKELVREMMDKLAHRGPDAEGMHAGLEVVLGHRRLSIMDPAGGNQPIYGEEGFRAIVANGEIYNFFALRDELKEHHRLRTLSDSEVAVHLFEDLGSETAGRLDGMFAIAIADGENLYLARDPIGIKPLYVGTRRGTLMFGSELKALAGIAEEVCEFPPGHWFHSGTGLHQYYSVPDRAPREMPLSDRLKLVRETLERAVVKRLMSDVPVGAFLSGGVDSSLIAAIARRHVDVLHTFSVGLEGSRDLEAARQVASHLGTTHHEYVYTAEEVVAQLPKIIYSLESFDQDLVRSATPCFFAARLAAERVKVILTGEGADELFAGYRYYREIGQTESLHRELRRSVCSLHNINLQRVDRLTMAHSIEGRVPFLDLEMIEAAQTIPPGLKLREGVDKWILRKACEDLLPPAIVWRAKEQFDEGSGTSDLLPRLVGDWMDPGEAGAYAMLHVQARLRSNEECVYHKLLTEVYSEPGAILDNVARWAERPEASQAFDWGRPA